MVVSLESSIVLIVVKLGFDIEIFMVLVGDVFFFCIFIFVGEGNGMMRVGFGRVNVDLVERCRCRNGGDMVMLIRVWGV